MTVNQARSDWWSAAACQYRDPELFFPISSLGSGARQVAEAKTVCGQCEVRPQCLSYALTARQLHGIWGGTTEEERQLLRERDRVRQAAAV
jgi:WhiB family transcriptional regulator, redox-sensing transcriptional regulator